MALARRLTTLLAITTLTNAADEKSHTTTRLRRSARRRLLRGDVDERMQRLQIDLRARGRRPPLLEDRGRLQTLGDDDDTEPALVVVENGDRGITMTCLRHARTRRLGGLATPRRLCALRVGLVAQDETPCYCGDATDDCFEHPDVIRDLTKYVDETTTTTRTTSRRSRRRRGRRRRRAGGSALGLRLTH